MTYCRWAPSLGSLEATHQEVWGTMEYKWWRDFNKPTVFFGLYDLRDYLALWWHRGHAWVLWAGSDIRNLGQGFLFNDGKLKWMSVIFKFGFINLIKSVLRKAEHWVENETERRALEECGIWVTGVCPSFLGKIEDFKIKFAVGKRTHVYLSSGWNRQVEYGFELVDDIAASLPEVTFHLYGAPWLTKKKNVKVHGRVPKKKMNKDIEGYQIGLRLNSFDGFSEILAKAVLMGQYAVGNVKHPKIPSFRDRKDLVRKIRELSKKVTPNIEARMWYEKNLNRYPWNVKLKNV